MAPALVVVGGSRGGAQALKTILAAIPAGFPLPVAAVLHRGPGDEALLGALISAESALPAADAGDKEPLLPGRVYLAPPDYHLLVEFPQPGPGGAAVHSLALSTEAPVLSARPSIDVLFESAADAFGSGLVAVLLSGGSEDGAAGLARVLSRGGLTFVQDPAEAEDPAMPSAALALAEHTVLPLAGIAATLAALGRTGAGK